MLSESVATLLAAVIFAYGPTGHSFEEFECAVHATYFEASGEPMNGKIEVLHVIQNRVDDWRWPDTVCGVVKQPYQFSYLNSKTPTLNPKNSIDWRALEETIHSVYMVFNGQTVDTIGATHYYAPSKASPVWSTDGVIVGNHKFIAIR